MKCDINDRVEYECASCHGYFIVPLSHFQGFMETIRLAASMGREGNHFYADRVPTVNACCPDCFQKVNAETKG